MSYTVYVGDIASYVSGSLDQAMDLAEPYIGLGRPVDIRFKELDVPDVVWHFDYNTFNWARRIEPNGGSLYDGPQS